MIDSDESEPNILDETARNLMTTALAEAVQNDDLDILLILADRLEELDDNRACPLRLWWWRYQTWLNRQQQWPRAVTDGPDTNGQELCTLLFLYASCPKQVSNAKARGRLRYGFVAGVFACSQLWSAPLIRRLKSYQSNRSITYGETAARVRDAISTLAETQESSVARVTYRQARTWLASHLEDFVEHNETSYWTGVDPLMILLHTRKGPPF